MNITVYCGSSVGMSQAFAEAAHQLGTWIGNQGHTLVYGGSSVGLMGILSRAVLEAGGTVVGVEPRFFIDAGVAQHNLSELYVVDTMAERKAKMIELGDIFIALPGGVGTLEEISEIMSRIRLNLTSGPCYFLNLDDFYTPMINLLHSMESAGFLPGFDHESFRFPRTVDELTEQLAQLHPDHLQHSCESDWEQPDWISGQLASAAHPFA